LLGLVGYARVIVQVRDTVMVLTPASAATSPHRRYGPLARSGVAVMGPQAALAG